MMSIFEYSPTLLLIVAIYLAYRDSIKNHNRHVEDSKVWLDFLENKFAKGYKEMRERFDKLDGVQKKTQISAKIAEKTADRAFNMASSANLGVVALQKALAVPRLMTKQQGLQNKFAKNEVDKLFNGEGTFDWLRPILSDEELEIIDKAEELKERQMNGEQKI